MRLPQQITSPALAVVMAFAGAARAGDLANSVEFQPVFNPRFGLELRVQNYSKLSTKLVGIDVFLGGDGETAICHVAVPGITLAPAARSSVIVADAESVNGCLPPGTPARRSERLTPLDNLPLRSGEPNPAPVPVERSVRIVPHFAADTESQQLRFRLTK